MSFRFIATVLVASSASLASAQTFIWTGSAGTGLWSTPGNWAGGVAPAASTSSTLDFSTVQTFPRAKNDLGEDFDVGTLKLGPQAIEGGRVRVNSAVQSIPTVPPSGIDQMLRISLAGNVTFTSSDTAAAPGSPAKWVVNIREVSGTGSATFHGGWRVDGLNHSGSLTVAADASLNARRTAAPLGALNASGVYDVVGPISLPAGSVADLRSTVVDLGRNDSTLGGAVAGLASFDRDVRVGGWVIGGYGFGAPNPIDRIDTTGTLDLTAVDVYPNPNAQLSTFTIPDYLVLASYGNRIGQLDVTSILVSNSVGAPSTFITGQIVYTSAENAGPGEIRVMLPEPSSLLALALTPAIARRRRR